MCSSLIHALSSRLISFVIFFCLRARICPAINLGSAPTHRHLVRCSSPLGWTVAIVHTSQTARHPVRPVHTLDTTSAHRGPSSHRLLHHLIHHLSHQFPARLVLPIVVVFFHGQIPALFTYTLRPRDVGSRIAIQSCSLLLLDREVGGSANSMIAERGTRAKARQMWADTVRG